VNYHQLPIQPRGGANNEKVEVGPELVQDIVALGVHGAAKKHGITPQTLYQRVYYRHGTTVKALKAQAAELFAKAQREEDHASSTDLPKEGG
jgi:hypothetical protein